MKRMSDSDLEAPDRLPKKSRTSQKRHFLRNKQPGAEAIPNHPQDDVLINHQLNKAICLAIYASGFSSVTREALSSFQDVIQEYMLHFSLRVHESMRSCRRATPVPQDFIHALAYLGLTASALSPDLLLSPPVEIVQAPILPAHVSQNSAFELDPFIPRNELFHASKERTHHIPKHFPIFPSKHSYNATSVFASREDDSLKLRERATHEGSQAEQALRNLMAASKVSDDNLKHNDNRSHDNALAEREKVWLDVLDAMSAEERARADWDDDVTNDGVNSGKKVAANNPSPGSGVAGYANYDRLFWRRNQKKEMLRAG